MRRNEEQPGCAFTLVDDPQKVRAAMDTMFTLHDMRWDGMGVPASRTCRRAIC
ncbi:MAG: hypothetical protein U0Y82_00165 [Thermoleophilia bacterium]